VTTHLGPYDQLRAAYRALGLWLVEQGFKMAGPPWEFYWTDPGAEPDPNRWRTEIIWPVVAASKAGTAA
jgi:effector-binding domain-containing protein